jgi:hypothetical protein
MIWFAFLAGPLAWALRELVSYALVRPACATGTPQLLVTAAAVMLGVTLIGIWVGWASLARPRGESAGTVAVRASFMANVTIGLNLLVALLIILSAIAEFVLNPCE